MKYSQEDNKQQFLTNTAVDTKEKTKSKSGGESGCRQNSIIFISKHKKYLNTPVNPTVKMTSYLYKILNCFKTLSTS